VHMLRRGPAVVRGSAEGPSREHLETAADRDACVGAPLGDSVPAF